MSMDISRNMYERCAFALLATVSVLQSIDLNIYQMINRYSILFIVDLYSSFFLLISVFAQGSQRMFTC